MISKHAVYPTEALQAPLHRFFVREDGFRLKRTLIRLASYMPLYGRSSYRIHPCSSYADTAIQPLTEILSSTPLSLWYGLLPGDAKFIYAIPSGPLGQGADSNYLHCLKAAVPTNAPTRPVTKLRWLWHQQWCSSTPPVERNSCHEKIHAPVFLEHLEESTNLNW